MFQKQYFAVLTVKAPSCPLRVYLISETPERGGGLIREVGLFTKSNDKEIDDSFQVLFAPYENINSAYGFTSQI